MFLRIVLLAIFATAALAQAFGSSFNGYANPYYVAATYNQLAVVPGVGQVSDSSYTGFVGNDPANSQIAVDLGAFKTYILPNITFNVINYAGTPVACLKVTGYTRAFEVLAKSAAIKTELAYVVSGAEGATGVDNLVLVSEYFGFVNDPGAGLNVKIAFHAYVDLFGNVRRTKFAQNAPGQRNPDGSCPPVAADLIGIIDTAPQVGPVNFPAGFFTPPALCANAYEYALAECL